MNQINENDKKSLGYFDLGSQSFFSILTLSKSVRYFTSSRSVNISESSQVEEKCHEILGTGAKEHELFTIRLQLQFMTRFRCG